MTKVCSKCNTSNPDEAGFCQKCGAKLLDKSKTGKNVGNSKNRDNFWKRQNNGAKIAIGIIGVLVLGFILIIASGIFAPLDNTPVSLASPVTYAYNSFSFNYPGDMYKTSYPFNVNSSNLQLVDYIGNENENIVIYKYPTSNSSYALRNQAMVDTDVVSINDKTNNGIATYGIIYKDKSDSGQLINYKIYFTDNNGTAYSINVFGDISKNSMINETATEVINTLKLN